MSAQEREPLRDVIVPLIAKDGKPIWIKIGICGRTAEGKVWGKINTIPVGNNWDGSFMIVEKYGRIDETSKAEERHALRKSTADPNAECPF